MNCPICKHKDNGRGNAPCSGCNGFNKWEPDKRRIEHVRQTNEINECVDAYVVEVEARTRIVRFSWKLGRYISNGGKQ